MRYYPIELVLLT